MTLEQTLTQIKERKVLVEIFGLGYVGFPLATKLAFSGFTVSGIDIDESRLQRLEREELEESEKHLEEEFFHSRKTKKISLDNKPTKSSLQKIGIIAVPTPVPSANKRSDIYVNSALEKFLETSKKGDIIIIESSVEVGTTDNVKKIIEEKGYKIGTDFGLAFCPERIDPQNKKWKLENIPRIIYCSDDTTYQISKYLYKYINNANLVRTKSAKTAEVVKSYENSFRLVNISLVNELSILCDNLKIDVYDVIRLASTKPFGFMPFYPSAGAGGHCIPKDPKFLAESSKKYGNEFKTIETALGINSFMPKYIAHKINDYLKENQLSKSVLVCGLSYKPNVEDMRDSPGFKIINELVLLGMNVGAYDPYFDENLLQKYQIENNLNSFDITKLKSLDDQEISNYSCLCVVQNHTKTKTRIEEIYEKSLVPYIYDCQNFLEKNTNSKTILNHLY